MTLTIDPTTITLIGAIILNTIAAIAAAIVSVITATRQAKTDIKVDSVAKSTAQIETSVNSEKAAALGREMALQSLNQMLRDTIEDHKRAAGLLAQAAAIQRQSPVAQTSLEQKNTMGERDKRIADAQHALDEARRS